MSITKILHLSFKLCCFLFLISTPVIAQVGTLDLSFSNDGFDIPYITAASNSGRAVAIQSDGKIIAGGQTPSGSDYAFTFVRYKTNGELDSIYGSDGDFIYNIGGTSSGTASSFEDMVLQSDDKLIAVGYTNFGVSIDYSVIRIKTTGEIDSTFGINGLVMVPVSASNDGAYAVTLQQDGKIVVVGNGIMAGQNYAVAVRLETDGALDPTFDGDGILFIDFGGNSATAHDVKIQNDGKILVCAQVSMPGNNIDNAVVRLNTDGSFDTTFDGDGKVFTDFGSQYDFPIAMALKNTGEIVVVGGYNLTHTTLAQYLPNGTLDNSFSGDGKLTTIFSNFETISRDVQIQNDGKIVVAATIEDLISYDFALLRFNIDGTPDTGFDGDGVVKSNITGSNDDIAQGLAIQNDGKLVIAGQSNTSTANNFCVARYNGICIASIFSQDFEFCFGQTVTVGTNVYASTGIYVDTLVSSTGCDSIVTTDLLVHPNSSVNQNVNICQGESLTVGNNVYTTGGVYVDVLQTMFGCDSTITTVLNVLPNASFSQTITIPNGDSVVVGTSVYTTTGLYIDTLVSWIGCDSIVTTNLTVLTGILEIGSDEMQIGISPNPFNNEIVVSGTNENSQILIFNIQGEIVFRKEGNRNETIIDLSILSGGTYFLQYVNDKNYCNIKILKL